MNSLFLTGTVPCSIRPGLLSAPFNALAAISICRCLTDARARHVIGLGLVDALSHAVPELPAERYQDMVESLSFSLSVTRPRIDPVRRCSGDAEGTAVRLVIPWRLPPARAASDLERALDHSGSAAAVPGIALRR